MERITESRRVESRLALGKLAPRGALQALHFATLIVY